MIIVVMGVTGSGKTTVGRLLAEFLHCEYVEGDRLHPASNIEKMSRGVPLTDEDRAPWLAAINARLHEAYARDRDLVLGCSALKASYREMLAEGVPITWVYLEGPTDLIRTRIARRRGHFAKTDLLPSQMETLEPPLDAIVADISAPPLEIVRGILTGLSRPPVVHIREDIEPLSAAASEAIVAILDEVVKRRGTCSLALSGGSTPRRLYELLGGRLRDRVPWSGLRIVWCDERYVPPDDPRSNFHLARRTLLAGAEHAAATRGASRSGARQDPGDAREELALYPMPTGFPDPESAAREYEGTLRGIFPGEWPRLDLVILGLGSDGHIASLFPGSAALHERTRWVLPVTAPADPPTRLTLTLPVLTRADRVHLLVAGREKAPAVARALSSSGDPRSEPAASLAFAKGEVVWWLDRAAAQQMES